MSQKLSGQELDAAVAKCIGIESTADTSPRDPGAWMSVPAEGKTHFFRPSSSWNDCGPLIGRFGVELMPDGPNSWAAFCGTAWGGDERCSYEAAGFGATPQEAICRCVVEWVQTKKSGCPGT